MSVHGRRGVFDMANEEKVLLLLNQIGNELQLLWSQMSAYQELFLVEQEKRRSLLQDSAPGFFAPAQISFAESILMRIFRLMDPAESRHSKNSSLALLQDELSNENPAQCFLKDEVQALRKEWDKGRYSILKGLRNKWLAHNDSSTRAESDLNQIWEYLSLSDFALAQQLAGEMWSLYRRSSLVLRGTDVFEPAHATLAQRPAMILRHLCSSQFLYRSLDELDEQALGNYSALEAYEHERMGEDLIREVFSSPGRKQ